MCVLTLFKISFCWWDGFGFAVAKGGLVGWCLCLTVVGQTQVDTTNAAWNELDSLIGDFENWEQATAQELGIPTYIEGDDFQETFAKRFQIKIVRKYRTLLREGMPPEKQWEYTLTYDQTGHLMLEQTPYQRTQYIYNERGFLDRVEGTSSGDGATLSLWLPLEFATKKKVWTKGFPYTTLKECLYLDEQGDVVQSVQYHYVSAVLISKIMHYNAAGRCLYYEHFEYDFYP